MKSSCTSVYKKEEFKVNKLNELNERLITNDTCFIYKNKEYIICPLTTSKIVIGEAIPEDKGMIFKLFKELIYGYEVDGIKLKDFVSEIEFI